MFTFRTNYTCLERFNEKGCLLGSLCVSEAHAKEQTLVIFKINIVARQQSLPSPYDHTHALGGGRGEVGVGPLFASLSLQLQPSSGLENSSWAQERGSTVAQKQMRHHTSQ